MAEDLQAKVDRFNSLAKELQEIGEQRQPKVDLVHKAEAEMKAMHAEGAALAKQLQAIQKKIEDKQKETQPVLEELKAIDATYKPKHEEVMELKAFIDKAMGTIDAALGGLDGKMPVVAGTAGEPEPSVDESVEVSK